MILQNGGQGLYPCVYLGFLVLYSSVAFTGMSSYWCSHIAVLFCIAGLGCRMLLLILLDVFLPAALMAGACWLCGLLAGIVAVGCVYALLWGPLACCCCLAGYCTVVLVAQLVGLVSLCWYTLFCLSSVVGSPAGPGVPCCGALVHAIGLKFVVHACCWL
jgi:hypothetical protein